MKTKPTRRLTDPAATPSRQLGSCPIESMRLRDAPCVPANDTTALKEQLMGEISGWIGQHGLKQAAAAEILQVSRPRVSDVVNKKASKFTMDALVEMLSRVGKPVTLSIGEVPGNPRTSANVRS